MEQPKPACQNPKQRTGNVGEVSLGFNKKISANEAHRCPQCAEPTCLAGCPLGIDIPGFIRLLRDGDVVSALERIKQDNPFPAICGRICPAPCENACIFHEEGSPIAIRALERYAADFGYKPHLKTKTTLNTNGKKVAVVGSGPSAMAAASVLLKEGFAVVMFEAANEPGGLLRYGVAEFRLPQKIVEAQFEELKSQGLELHTNMFIGRMKSLEELRGAFDAVLLAIGAAVPDFSLIEGENLSGVCYAEEFLMRLQMLSKENVSLMAGSLLRGATTVVVGRGYAAFDAARMAIRLGQQVHLVFAGLEEEIGVSSDDLKEALEEGLNIQAPVESLKIVADTQGFVAGLQCRRMDIMETQDGLRLEPLKDSQTVLEAQTIILANGQKANHFLAQMTPSLKTNPNGTVWINDKTAMTCLEKVFATASAVAGPMTVVEALASGKGAAKQIIGYLQQ
ncbi:MAG: FAD-dependent oxidoreductase [Candidatus Omnitrophica bacterium]|nr:FAD-dependent oxidoreductase [Candidatus Omnitrophota bacterium]